MEKEIATLEKEIAVLRAEFEAYKQEMELHLTMVEKARVIADAAMAVRLDKMNELREMVNDQARRFVFRDIFDTKMENIDQKIYTIQKMIWMMAGGYAVITIVINLISKFI